MQQLAVYGKGGIGKSTISAHLSAALSRQGLRVVQVGCDPKHDSTRLLTGGRVIPTVLDYLRTTNPLDYRLQDILFEGYNGVGCVEAGGPMPGVGCAGRGIISTFELLEQFNIARLYDLALYDVLGDVVCGGFAVPIRQEYADSVFIVTSGGFMSLYAANNILRGVQNYDQERPRVAGILHNRGGQPGEDERVQRLAQAVGLPVVATFPRSESFAKAEREGRTLIESGEDEEITALFASLAQAIIKGLPLFKAAPLSDEDLEQCVLERQMSLSQGFTPYPGDTPEGMPPDNRGHVFKRVPCPQEGDTPEGMSPQQVGEESSDVAPSPAPNRYLSKNVIKQEPLHGCAFNGAVSMCLHLMDAVVLAHAPKSCAFLSYQSINSTGRRSLFERGALLPVSLAPNLECTELNESDMIFGGMEHLQSKLEDIRQQDPAAIVVVSACPAGIIGDDIEQVACAGGGGEPPVVTLKTDGNISGDYLQGMLMSYTSLARGFIKKEVGVVPKTVNIVFEKVIAKNTNENYALIEDYLARMGVSVNCRFLCETTVERLQNFCSAPLNLLAYKDYTGTMLQHFFEEEYGCTFFEQPFPVGFAETSTWLRSIAARFDATETAEELIKEGEAAYWQEVERLRPALQGKKLMIITYNHNLDWILQTALDVGIEVVKVGILNFSQDTGFTTQLDITLDVEEDYDRDKRLEDITLYKPHILLSNYEFPGEQTTGIMDTIPMCPDVGFSSGLELARRWAAMLKTDLQGEWRQDEQLYQKYYA